MHGVDAWIGIVLGVVLLAAIAFAIWCSVLRHARRRDTVARMARYRDAQTTDAIAAVMAIIDAGHLVGPDAIGTLTPEESTRIEFLLDEWTEIALGIRLGIYDEGIWFSLYGGTARFFWTHLRPFMKARRGDTGREFSWAEFDRLAVRWLIRMHSVDSDKAVKQLKTLSGMLDQTLGG